LENVFDLKEIKHSFNFSSLWMRIIRKAIKIDVIKEDPLYHPEVLELSGWAYYSGYWISEEYFKEVENEVRDSFKFKGKLVHKNKDVAERIYNCNSVSIHIRRGDYLETDMNRKIYGNICTLNYYEKAIAKIHQKVENPSFFIFSNDIDWCRENLEVINAEYIDWNTGDDSFRDMQLMSLCKSNILANSTFSWWGAWLNVNKEKNVLVPSRFFNDILASNMDTLVPKDWIRI
jgi:hypothetical protein